MICNKNTNVMVGKLVFVSLDCVAHRFSELEHNTLSMGWSQGIF